MVFVSFVFAKEYFIGYDLYLKDKIAVDWRYYLSPLMYERGGKRKLLCQIKTDKIYKKDEEFFEDKEEEVLECLFKNRVFIQSFEKIESNIFDSIDILKLPFIKIELTFSKNRASIFLISR